MVITPKDVEADLLMLMQSIEDKNRPLAKPWQALKLSMAWPVSCVLGYVISMVWTIFSYKPYINHYDRVVSVFDDYGISMGFASFSVLMALLIGASLYGNALIYLSIEADIKRKSLIFSKIRTVVVRLCIIFFILNFSLAALAAKYPDLLVCAPFMFMISVLIIGFVIKAEISRYGMPSLLLKLSRLVKRI